MCQLELQMERTRASPEHPPAVPGEVGGGGAEGGLGAEGEAAALEVGELKAAARPHPKEIRPSGSSLTLSA